MADELEEPTGAPPTLEDAPPRARRTRKRSSASSGSSGSGEPATPPEPREARGEPEEPRKRSSGSGEQHSAPRHNALNPVSAAADNISGWPVPGGLALLLTLAVILLFVVVPVNAGQTRVQLLWNTVRGRVRLPGVVTQADQQSTDAAAASSASSVISAATSAYQSAANAVSGELGPVPSVIPGVGSGVPSMATGDYGAAPEMADYGLSAFGSGDYGAIDLESIFS